MSVLYVCTAGVSHNSHSFISIDGYLNKVSNSPPNQVSRCVSTIALTAATDCTLSLTTARVRILAWACEKVASELGLGGGFRRVLRFPPQLTTGQSRISHNWHKCDEIPNYKRLLLKCTSTGKICIMEDQSSFTSQTLFYAFSFQISLLY